MNNYRKTFPYLTITGLLLFAVACNPFPTNLHPDTVEAPIIITINPIPNQPSDLEHVKIFLFDAIDKGDIKSFQDTWRQLKAANPTIDLSHFTDELGNTLLHRAAEKGNILLLEFLVFHSIDKDTYIDAVNYLDQSPLHIAVIHKHLHSIEWLITVGADPMVYDSEGFTPLHIAIIDGNLDIVERLTQGSNVIALIGLPTKVEGHTAIRLAYMKKHVDMVRYLMHLKYYKSNEKLTSAELLIALEYEWVDLIEALIQEKRIEVNQKGILQLAANKGYLKLLECLIDQLGKDPNEKSAIPRENMTNTAAYQAIRGSHPEVLRYLLEKGSKQRIDKPYDTYTSDLLEIALERYIKHKQQAIRTQDATTLNAIDNEVDKKLSNAKKVIDIILASRRSNFDLPIIITSLGNKRRYTFSPEILNLASRAGLDIFKSVLFHLYASDRKKIVTDIKDAYYSPIHGASEAGDTALVEYLLSMKANVNSKSPTGPTPLIHAIKSGNRETVQHLITKRANVNKKIKRNCTPLYEAVKGGHKDIFELLLNYGARIQDKEDDGNTLLHAAALSKNVIGSDTTEMRISIQDIIAKIGAKGINAKDSFGCTPLHYAAQIGNQASVSTLLAVGADPHAQTEESQTPLELTLKWNSLATAKQLLMAGTNLDKCSFGYRQMQDKLLKLILFILKDKEEIVGENIVLVNRLIKKADEITLRKLVIHVLTANPQTTSLQEKCLCDRLIKEHNIQLIDCLARIMAEYQDNYQFDYQDNYSLNNEEILFCVYQLIELYGLSPVDCIYQLILSKKENADPLLYHLINKYKVSPLHMLNNAITQGRKDIVSLLIAPYYESTKDIIIKQCVAANDFRVISRFIQYDKDNGSLNNVNYIISQATKLNKLDIVQFLITQCPLNSRMIVADLIKEISNTPYIANMYNMYIFVQNLMVINSLHPEDFAIWAAAADKYEVVRYILIQYNLSSQQLIDYAIEMNNELAVSFLKDFSQAEKLAFSQSEVSDSNIDLRPIKKQKNNNDPS